MALRIYIGMADGLTAASRRNGAWHMETHLDGRLTQCVAYDPLRPERVYCGTFHDGLWRSDDAGANWRPAGAGLTHRSVMAVAVSRLERGRAPDGSACGVVCVGTEPSALFRSEDGGETWREQRALGELPSAPTWSFPPRPYTHHVRWIEPDPAVAERVFVSIEQGGVMRSLDGGQTFEDRRPGGPCDAHTLASHRDAPGLLYAPSADGMGATGKAIMTSRDGGTTWQPAGGGIRHSYGWSVAVDPGNPERAVYSGAFSPRQAHDSAVAHSTMYHRRPDGTWEEARDGLPDPAGTVIYVLAANPAEPGVFYAACNWGVFRSADAGRRWGTLDLPWPERYRTQHVQGLAVVEAN
ncbi:MAG: glycosyl hydrolase [Chloroflexi bacterium]|nr:glycosyl hydrolase [Chloroflexota bacterium]